MGPYWMHKATNWFSIGTALLVIGMAVVLAWNALPNARRWEQGYSQIAEGDPEDKVLEILGKPTEIRNCDQLRYSRPELWQKCAEEYWYVAFMQEWCYVIDKDGKVLIKWHSVSP
jgi:hypothetical protein